MTTTTTTTTTTTPTTPATPATTPLGPASSRARRPVSAPVATRFALLLALALLAAAAVLIRDALVSWDVVPGQAWTTQALTGLDGLRAQSWMVPAGGAAAMAGLALLVAAVLPARRPEIALGGSGAVWLRRKDLARIARGTATQTAGVVRVQAAAARSTVRVQVVTTAADPGPIRDAVALALTTAFAPLTPAPAVKVRARALGDS